MYTVYAVGVGEGLPAAVVERTRMRGHHGTTASRGSGGEQHDRHVAFGGLCENLPQLGRLPHRLKDQNEHSGARQFQRILSVGGRRGDKLLAGRDRQREPEGPACAQQRGEYRSGVGDKGDRARRATLARRTALARRAARASKIAAFAACQPGMPHTPPPACVAELA